MIQKGDETPRYAHNLWEANKIWIFKMSETNDAQVDEMIDWIKRK